MKWWITNSWTQLSNWTELNWWDQMPWSSFFECCLFFFFFSLKKKWSNSFRFSTFKLRHIVNCRLGTQNNIPCMVDISIGMLSFKPAFHSPLSPSSRGSLVPLHFLPLECYHLQIWDHWCSWAHCLLCIILWPSFCNEKEKKLQGEESEESSVKVSTTYRMWLA